MLRSKNIDRVCAIVLAVTMLLAGAFTWAASAGVFERRDPVTYADRLFDQSTVHTIDIVIDDWDAFLSTCTSEEYSLCSLVIDGEKYTSEGIRGKGNTSLSQVAQYGNDRYSFKIEFDHYQSSKSYHGLDKLCLNNIIQDATYMKDYLAYTLMNRLGVAAPLCSFVQINVNGEYWGLYLAVEAVEDGFLSRNYDNSTGDLYKPDSTSMGGGKGNGRDFDMDDFREQFEQRMQEISENGEDIEEALATMFPSFDGEEGFPTPPEFGGEGFPAAPDFSGDGEMTPPEMPGSGGTTSEEMTEESDMPRPEMPESSDITMPEETASEEPSSDTETRGRHSRMGGFGGGEGFGGSMGSDDTLLKYIDDDPDSYANIFDSAKTDVTDADKARLIAALKALNEEEDIASCVDIESVIRYFVVHGFLVNGDSYTGSMIHNYYLYEQDGILSMIPWDYNLAFGAFSMGRGGGNGSEDSATSAVNNPIDTPVTSGSVDEKPMLKWIFDSEEYTELYHEIYAEFMADIYESGWLQEEIDRVAAMIDPYVKDDPTAFYTYDEFLTAVEALKTFCELRCESIEGQLDGTIPSTQEGQTADSSALIDASALNLSDMGGMSMGGQGGGFGGEGGGMEMRGGFGGMRPDGNASENGEWAPPDFDGMQPSGDMAPPEGDESSSTMTSDTAADEDDSERPSFGGMGFPDGGFGGGPGQGEGFEGSPTETSQNAQDNWLWFGGSIALLAVGLIFALTARKCR